MQDAETGEQIFVDTHDRGFRKRFAAAAERRETRAARGVRATPASTRSSCRPTTTSSTRSCASPTCASGAASSRAGGGAAARTCVAATHDVPLARAAVAAACCVPLLVAAATCWLLRRKKQAGAALREPRAWSGRRWAPGSASAATCRRVLFLLALTLMIVAIARPAAVVTLPSQHETDHPRDGRLGQHARHRRRAQPPRGGAGRRASAFVADQPREHAHRRRRRSPATASVVQPPTHNREDILAAIDRFQLQRGTAVGSGILVSLKTIFPDAEFDLRSCESARATRANGAAPLDRRRSRASDKAGVQAGAAGLVHRRRRSSC